MNGRTCLLLFLVIGVVAGCNSSDDTSATNGHEHSSGVVQAKYDGKYPIQVVCTTGMVADLAKNIGGEHVKVSSLMGAGVDPHLFTASPSDVSQLRRADLILYSGLHLEGKLAELLGRIGESRPT